MPKKYNDNSNKFKDWTTKKLKQAIQTAKEIKKKNSYIVYADPETGHEPEKPDEVYIYEATLIKEL